MNQATQVNVWDKLLITNGEKIVLLNQEVERVKFEQQQLEHELDYVVSYICVIICQVYFVQILYTYIQIIYKVHKALIRIDESSSEVSK